MKSMLRATTAGGCLGAQQERALPPRAVPQARCCSTSSSHLRYNSRVATQHVLLHRHHHSAGGCGPLSVRSHTSGGNRWLAQKPVRATPSDSTSPSSSSNSEVVDASYGFVAQNAGALRALPLWLGAGGIAALILNRVASGIAPVVDASSSQSRTDVIGIVLSAVLLLTGLQWLALKPRPVEAVPLDGDEVAFVDEAAGLPPAARQELLWAWDALRASTRCRSLVLIYQGRNVFHAGQARRGWRLGGAKAGDITAAAVASGQGNYLPNLLLFSGRDEFYEYLPEGMQGVLVQPVGNSGVLIAGTDVVRGFSRLDQAWVATIADKLQVTLEGYTAPQPGVGFAATGGKDGGSKGKGRGKQGAAGR